MVGACGAATPAEPNFTPGKQFDTVPSPVTPDNPKQVTVQEFFWYGCPHCFRADPEIEQWASSKPADVVFERIPDTLGRPIGEVHARAFYIAKTLGILDKMHSKLFAAIHVQQMPLDSLDSLREFFVGTGGVTAKQFDDASSSFVVDTELRRSQSLAQRYAILSVPTFIVGGKYRTDGGMAGSDHPGQSEEASFKEALQVVDFLVQKVRKERS